MFSFIPPILEALRKAQKSSQELLGSHGTKSEFRQVGRPLHMMVNDESKEVLRPVILELDNILRKYGMALYDLRGRQLFVVLLDQNSDKKESFGERVKRCNLELETWEHYHVLAPLIDGVCKFDPKRDGTRNL